MQKFKTLKFPFMESKLFSFFFVCSKIARIKNSKKIIYFHMMHEAKNYVYFNYTQMFM